MEQPGERSRISERGCYDEDLRAQWGQVAKRAPEASEGGGEVSGGGGEASMGGGEASRGGEEALGRRRGEGGM